MDFNIKRKSMKSCVIGSRFELYPHDLQLYKIPPTEDISLHEFETLALERLSVLRTLTAATTLKGFKPFSEEWKDYILTELKKHGLKYYVNLCQKSGTGTQDIDYIARRKDHIAHFILRLAYCRTEELRRWFISRELELFRMRFYSMSGEAVDTFFKINKLRYTNITNEEKDEIIIKLRESTSHNANQSIDNLKFYKVKFYEVLDLIKSRKVYLQGGNAYIPHKDFISVLSAQFRTHLKQNLVTAYQHLGEIDQDERLVSLLKGLHQSYSGNDFSSTKAAVPIESLDSLSVKSFPLCMRQLHEQLRQAHHLKHVGRLQYGLFLKGLGVTLEDSLKFWRSEFTKIMELDKFEKQYAYNIRYNYGKEGSKKNYSPFNCLKIINTSVGPGECHGCPYKHSDENNLKNILKGYGYEAQGVKNIVEMAKKGHYQIACSKYFDLIHNVDLGLGINHPNEFFEQSQKQLGDVKVDIKQETKISSIKSESNNIEDMDFEEIGD